MNVLATINSYDDLHELLRRRAEQLELSRPEIDRLAGLTPGHASKLLAPQPMKRIGPETFKFLLPALGIALVAIEDLQSMEQIRLAPKRDSSRAMHAVAVHRVFSRRHMRKIAKKGGQLSRSKMTKRRAKQIGRNAALIRWAQVKAAVRAPSAKP